MTEFKFGPEHVGQRFKRRDGQDVEIVACVPRAINGCRLVALHPGGHVHHHYEDGTYVLPGIGARDIMPPPRTYYIAVCEDSAPYWITGLHDSEQAARQAAGGVHIAAIVTVELQ
jgi:hypothetical protein